MHQVNDLFAGRYTLIAGLGGGGLGQVFRAHDLLERKEVALKIYAAEVGADQWQRYARVVAAAGRVKGCALALARLQPAEDGEPAHQVSELLVGEDVEASRLRLGPVTGERIVEIAAACARALVPVTAATGAGHRALKPGNLWIEASGELRVLDYGVAELGLPAPRPRADGTHVEYRAPEQLEGSPGDARSDVYSLAVVLFELLTGVHPFAAPSAFKVAHRVLLQAPPRPTAVAPATAVVPQVEDTLARAMARAPDDRFVDVAAFARALALAERSSIALLPFGDEEPTNEPAPRDDSSSLVTVAPSEQKDEYSTLLVLKPLLAAAAPEVAPEAPAAPVVEAAKVEVQAPVVEAGPVGLLPLPGFADARPRAVQEPPPSFADARPRAVQEPPPSFADARPRAVQEPPPVVTTRSGVMGGPAPRVGTGLSTITGGPVRGAGSGGPPMPVNTRPLDDEVVEPTELVRVPGLDDPEVPTEVVTRARPRAPEIDDPEVPTELGPTARPRAREVDDAEVPTAVSRGSRGPAPAEATVVFVAPVRAASRAEPAASGREGGASRAEPARAGTPRSARGASRPVRAAGGDPPVGAVRGASRPVRAAGGDSPVGAVRGASRPVRAAGGDPPVGAVRGASRPVRAAGGDSPVGAVRGASRPVCAAGGDSPVGAVRGASRPVRAASEGAAREVPPATLVLEASEVPPATLVLEASEVPPATLLLDASELPAREVSSGTIELARHEAKLAFAGREAAGSETAPVRDATRSSQARLFVAVNVLAGVLTLAGLAWLLLR